MKAARYCYLSNSLRVNFDTRLYNEFRYAAVQDARFGEMYGMQCLFRFYSYGLENRFDVNLFQDFQYYVCMDLNAGYRYGIEKLWAYIHYSGNKPELLEEIREALLDFIV